MGIFNWIQDWRNDVQMFLAASKAVCVEREDGVRIDQWPPWKQFPGIHPAEAGLRQGNSQAYWEFDWLPYWRTLSSEQKLEYLFVNHAPEAWASMLKPDDADFITKAEDAIFDPRHTTF